MFLSSFDVTFISSSTPVTILSLFPSAKSFPPPPCPPCLAYRTRYPPCLGYNFPIIILLPIPFKPRRHPKAFSPLPLPRFITFRFTNLFSQLNSLYRIDSRNKPFRRLPSPKRLRLRRSKPVLTVRPPLRRFGVEMPRENLCAMPVVSSTFPFHSSHVDVPL